MTIVRGEVNRNNGHPAGGVWRGGRCPSSLDTRAGALARWYLAKFFEREKTLLFCAHRWASMLGVSTPQPLPEDPTMQPSTRTRRRRPDRGEHLGKPNGLLAPRVQAVGPEHFGIVAVDPAKARSYWLDRKSTRLNSSHLGISYAVFCLKKKKEYNNTH